MWIHKISNEDVLKIVKERISLLRITKKRNEKCIGYILKGNWKLTSLLEVTLEGEKKGEKRKLKPLADIKCSEPHEEMKTHVV